MKRADHFRCRSRSRAAGATHLILATASAGAGRTALRRIVRQLLELHCREFPHLHRRICTDGCDGLSCRAGRSAFSTVQHRTLRSSITAVIDLRRDPAAIRRRLGLHEGPATFASQVRPWLFLRHLLRLRLQGPPARPLQRRRAVHRPACRRRPRRQGRDPHRAWRDRHLCRAGRAGEPRRQCAAGAGAEARRPAADGGEGLPGVLLSLLGGDQGGHRAGAAQHAAARGRLRLHVRGLGLRARRLFDRVRGRDRAGAEAGAGRGADGRCLPRRDGDRRRRRSRRGSPRRPTTASGSIPPARPAGPRARSMPIATWW